MNVKVILKDHLGFITSWVFVLICFAYPISAVLSNLIGVPSTPVNAFYRAIIMLSSIYVIIVAASFNYMTVNNHAMPLIIFLLLYLIRILWDLLVAGVQSDEAIFTIFSYYLGSVIFPVFAILVAFKFINIRNTILRALYILLISNVLLLFSYLSQNGWEISPSMLISRAEILGLEDGLPIVNPISFGLYGGYLMLFCLAVLLFCRNEFSEKVIMTVKVGLLIGLINLIIGSSRGPFLFSFLGILAIFRVHFSYVTLKFSYYLKIIGAFSGVLVLILFGINYMSDNNIELGIFERLISMKENMEGGEKETRQELYAEAFELFKSSPVVGKQFVLQTTGSYPHNAVFEILMSMGMVGLFLYIATVFNLLLKIISFKKYVSYFSILIGLVVLSIGISLTSGNLYQSVDNWNLIAAIIAFSGLAEKESVEKLEECNQEYLRSKFIT